MSTNAPNLPTDAQLLYEYLGQQLDGKDPPPHGRAVVADLAAYQEQLDRLRTMVQAGEASLDAGRGRPLDLDALLLRVRERIAAEGKTA
jgi:hypothetical protein